MNKINILYLQILLLFNFTITSIDLGYKKADYALRTLDEQLKEKFFPGVSEFLHNIFLSEERDPYNRVVAKVRESSDLCPEEQKYLKLRSQNVKQSIEKLLNKKIEDSQVPNIAFCFSGGGYRAMISSLGSLVSAQDYGLLDCTTYISALSGSTWTLASLMAHDLTLSDLKQTIKDRACKPINHEFDIKLLLQNSISKIIYGQKLTLVGIWGSLIANLLFKDLEKKFMDQHLDHHKVIQNRLSRYQIPRLTCSQKKLVDGKHVFPIYTAVNVAKEYDWIEFTPYEIGSLAEKTYIPSWGLGRKFNKGVSTNFSTEYPIDYYLGIWGSAFTASVRDLLEVYREELPSYLYQALDAVVGSSEHGLGQLRISPAEIKNFAYGMSGQKFARNKSLTLVDAGLDFNLPLPPVLRPERKVDIIIVCDASSIVTKAPELRDAEEYARRNNLKFPKINYNGIGKAHISVFREDDPEIPVVIYMPMKSNYSYSNTFDPIISAKEGGFCSTFNLQYTPEQFDLLCGLSEYNMAQSFEVIRGVIAEFVDTKQVN